METTVVRVSVAPVLAARRVTSEQVTQALLGAPVIVLERCGRWARIRMEDGYEGWIARGHLAPAVTEASGWVTMTDLTVNLRTRPDFRMPARMVAFIGSSLPLHERQPGWLGVALPAGGVGWLEEHRARVHAAGDRLPVPEPEALIATAHRFLGVPYLWGGCSPLGLDCSGFVQLVYRLHGVSLPRDADQQFDVGLAAAARNDGPECPPRLAAGDGVFFHAVGEPSQISHVGLALGDGRFIHALGSDQVRIDAWAEAACTQRFAGARRYLPGAGRTEQDTPRARLPSTQAVTP